MLAVLGLFAAGVPMRAQQLASIATGPEPTLFPGLPPDTVAVYISRLGPPEAASLLALGVSLQLYAAYLLTFEVGLAVACAAVALTLFWRRSESWLTVWVSLVLVLLGTTATSPEIYTVTMTWDGWEMFPAAVGLLGMVSFLHLLCLAPDGQFVPRWSLRLAAGFTGGALALLVQGATEALFTALPGFIAAIAAWLVLSGAGIAGQVYRYRHVSGPVERQQIKWVAAGLAAVTLGIVTNGTLLYAASVGGGQARLLVNLLRTPLVCLWLLGLPVSLAFAVLRHRLWEIDVIIRRTLIYSVLTVVLAGTYLGCVVLLQTTFRWLTGQGQSQLVTVLSTLAIAALFGPVRNRVQRSIDRRFYRRKYDAARTVAAFAANARDETDLARLSEQLTDAVNETLQPASVGLWLRKGTSR